MCGNSNLRSKTHKVLANDNYVVNLLRGAAQTTFVDLLAVDLLNSSNVSCD